MSTLVFVLAILGGLLAVFGKSMTVRMVGVFLSGISVGFILAVVTL